MTTFKLKLATVAAACAMGLMAANAPAAQQVKMPKVAQNFHPAMSFSFALAEDAKLNIDTVSVKTESNEYYMTVSAAQLHKGINVDTTVAGALIKVSRGGNQDRALEAKQLKLFSAAAPETNIAGKVLGEQDLKTTGIFKNATAIKMDKSIAPGKFQLRYDGPLAKDGLFVINVKEKASANKLQLATQKQHVVKGEALNFDALMLKGNDTLVMNSIEAYIMSPSGKKFAVPTKQLASGMTEVNATEFAKTLDSVEPPIKGLYELHVDAKANDAGMQVIRTGKIAFALAEQTASLQPVPQQAISALKPKADIMLTVNEPGRYELRGILYGHDANGQLKPIMETHSAKNLESGNGIISMEFDRKILLKSDLAAPFVLKNVRLYDQTRMARL